jgi:hypothetical protein
MDRTANVEKPDKAVGAKAAVTAERRKFLREICAILELQHSG